MNSTTRLFTNKSHSINEPVLKGAAPAPSQTVRPADIDNSKRTKFNNTKKFKSKRKNKLSMMDNHFQHEFEEQRKNKNIMNSNRIKEPFSPTFEQPDDVLPSNQTSYRPLGFIKRGKNKSKQDHKNFDGTLESKIAPNSILKEVEVHEHPDMLNIKSPHNRTHSSNADVSEVAKFINPLNESGETTRRRKAYTKRRQDPRESTSKYKKRSKTGNGRYSRRSKPKTKSEERKDRKRIFSKSVDQSYHGENSSIYPHDVSII